MQKAFVANPVAVRAAVGASNTSVVTNMPNQPLTGVAISIEANLTTGNTSDDAMILLAMMRLITFRWKGTAIWATRGDDLFRMCRAMGLFTGPMFATSNAAASRRMMTVIVPFGRKLFHPDEAFPAVDKGTTELQIDWIASGTGYDNLRYTITPIQLIDAQPTSFIRCTTITDTPSATGNKDYDLPRLYPLLGIGLVETNSEPTVALKDIESAKILVNYQEYNYSLLQGNLARDLAYLKAKAGTDGESFTHVENIAGAYAQNGVTLAQRMLAGPNFNFNYLHFDPLNDGQYALDASGSTDLKLRLNFNTAAACRILPVEYWDSEIIKSSN